MTESTQESFRGPEVCKLVGISYRQLDYWARCDIVIPSINQANGSGSQRLYSAQDITKLKLLKQMLNAGVQLSTARTAIYAYDDLLKENELPIMVAVSNNQLAVVHTLNDVVEMSTVAPVMVFRIS